MNKQNPKDQQQNTEWSKQQKSNEGAQSGKQEQPGNQAQQGNQAGSQGRQQGQQGNQGQQGQGGQKKQEPVEEKSPNVSANRQEDDKSGENRDPEINMPSNEPEKTEKKIPNYE